MLAARPLDPFFGPIPFLIAVICVLGTVVGGVWLVVDYRKGADNAALDMGAKGRVAIAAMMVFMSLGYGWVSVGTYRAYQDVDRYEAALGRAVALLEHPDVPLEKILVAASSDEPALQVAAAEHPHAPSEALLGIALDGTPEAKLLVAGRRDAPTEALVLLSQDDNQETAWAALRNPYFPRDAANDALMASLTVIGS